MSYFSDLGLAEPILRALEAKGYDTPTPIQRDAIPALLEGRDLLGIAQTGTGKTAAFSLPSLHHLANEMVGRPKRGCRMLVLSPTRELAAQIADNLQGYARFLNLSVNTVFGGVPIGKQIKRLVGGTDILVATPGRLLDLIDQRALKLDDVSIFVLDEADQMMDLGFINPLKRIAALLPRNRQSLFFSATMPRAIADLGKQFLTNPVRVEVAPQSTTAERVEQYVTFVNQKEKQALLTLTLQGMKYERVLVFSRTKHGADRIVRHLGGARIRAAAIHGNKSQAQRTAALGAFKDGDIRILVATDIAARGIDVSGVSHVINFDIPHVAEQYVHRIGRTARAGAEGVAISFVDSEERGDLRAIEKLTGVKLTPVPLPQGFGDAAAQLPPPAKAVSISEEARGGANRGGGNRSRNNRPGGNRGGGSGRGGAGRGGSGADRREGEAGQRSEGQRPDGARPGGNRRRRRNGSVGAHKGAVKRTAR